MARGSGNGKTTAARPNVTPETVQQFTREAVIKRRAVSEAQGEYRAVLKRAKAAGVNTKALSEHINNRALDSDEVTRHYRDVFYYGAVNGAGYASQSDLFPTSGMDLHVSETASAEHQEFEASEAGYEAGRSGSRIEDCPYPVASPLAQIWSQAWRRGQDSIAAEMAPGESAPVGRSRSRRVNRNSADEERPAAG